MSGDLPATPYGLPAMTDKAIAAFLYRTGLFQRRGWPPEKAEAWADRLFQRDTERDDRRLCIECSNLQRGGWCARASRVLGRETNKDGRAAALQPVTDILQRCPPFAFQTP